MAISSRSRKILWARSGNKCAICQVNLIRLGGQKENVIIGEECHIISKSIKGPRGQHKIECANHDDYENLILLCSNDHVEIDHDFESYSIKRLKEVKRTHENWVKERLNSNPQEFNNPLSDIIILKKVEDANDIIEILKVCSGHILDYQKLKREKVPKEILILFDYIKDVVDVLSFMNYSQFEVMRLDLNNLIDEIENHGYLVFALQQKIDVELGANKSAWDVVNIQIIKSENVSIVGDYLFALYQTSKVIF